MAIAGPARNPHRRRKAATRSRASISMAPRTPNKQPSASSRPSENFSLANSSCVSRLYARCSAIATGHHVVALLPNCVGSGAVRLSSVLPNRPSDRTRAGPACTRAGSARFLPLLVSSNHIQKRGRPCEAPAPLVIPLPCGKGHNYPAQILAPQPPPNSALRAASPTQNRRSSTRGVNHTPLARGNENDQCFLKRGRGE